MISTIGNWITKNLGSIAQDPETLMQQPYATINDIASRAARITIPKGKQPAVSTSTAPSETPFSISNVVIPSIENQPPSVISPTPEILDEKQNKIKELLAEMDKKQPNSKKCENIINALFKYDPNIPASNTLGKKNNKIKYLNNIILVSTIWKGRVHDIIKQSLQESLKDLTTYDQILDKMLGVYDDIRKSAYMFATELLKSDQSKLCKDLVDTKKNKLPLHMVLFLQHEVFDENIDGTLNKDEDNKVKIKNEKYFKELEEYVQAVNAKPEATKSNTRMTYRQTMWVNLNLESLNLLIASMLTDKEYNELVNPSVKPSRTKR
jgi:hypothetical protein